VLPLSNNSALIGWVNDCDTLSKLISQYRATKNVNLNVEEDTLFRYILLAQKEWKEDNFKKFAKYDRLPLLGKVEVTLSRAYYILFV
jgi:phosphatidylinositol kinase/protein kinase (PI-3  family)